MLDLWHPSFQRRIASFDTWAVLWHPCDPSIRHRHCIVWFYLSWCKYCCGSIVLALAHGRSVALGFDLNIAIPVRANP